MKEYIKIPLTEQMKKDYAECAEMADDGLEKDCSSCSMNGGNHECLGEYSWIQEEER